MVIGLKIADGTFTHKMNKMSENLDRALDKVIESGKPNCTILEVMEEYKSDTKFNAKGMGGLYNISKKFMDLIIPADFIPKGKKEFFIFIFLYLQLKNNLQRRWLFTNYFLLYYRFMYHVMRTIKYLMLFLK